MTHPSSRSISTRLLNVRFKAPVSRLFLCHQILEEGYEAHNATHAIRARVERDRGRYAG